MQSMTGEELPMVPRLWDHAIKRIQLPLIFVGITVGSASFFDKGQKFSFEYIKFVMLIKHPNENTEFVPEFGERTGLEL